MIKCLITSLSCLLYGRMEGYFFYSLKVKGPQCMYKVYINLGNQYWYFFII